MHRPIAGDVSGAFWHRGPWAYGPHNNAHAFQHWNVGLGVQHSVTGILGRSSLLDISEIECTGARLRSLGPFVEGSHQCPGPTTPYTVSIPEWSLHLLVGQPRAPPGWRTKRGQILHPETRGIPGHLQALVPRALGSHQKVQGLQEYSHERGQTQTVGLGHAPVALVALLAPQSHCLSARLGCGRHCSLSCGRP